MIESVKRVLQNVRYRGGTVEQEHENVRRSVENVQTPVRPSVAKGELRVRGGFFTIELQVAMMDGDTKASHQSKSMTQKQHHPLV